LKKKKKNGISGIFKLKEIQEFGISEKTLNIILYKQTR
jgi:hypothetical protein